MEPVTAHWRSLGIAAIAVFGALCAVGLPVNQLIAVEPAWMTVAMAGAGGLLGALLALRFCPHLPGPELAATTALQVLVFLAIDRDDAWSTIAIATAAATLAAALAAALPAARAATPEGRDRLGPVFAMAVFATALGALFTLGRAAGLPPGPVAFVAVAAAGAATVLVIPTIRPGQVWLGQMLLGVDVAIGFAAGEGSVDDFAALLVGFSVVSTLGWGAALCTRAFLPEAAPPPPLPGARTVRG